MIELKEIVNAISQCPDYIGKGIVQLLVLTLGGILVAWITTIVFGRKSEINAVEGALLKRKLDIYEELSAKLEHLISMTPVQNELYIKAFENLKKRKVRVVTLGENLLPFIFTSLGNLMEQIGEIDNFITIKKLYFDNEVLAQAMQFQDYLSELKKILVGFEQNSANSGIKIGNRIANNGENIAAIELGMMIQEEFIDGTNKFISSIKNSFKNLSFEHRDNAEIGKNVSTDIEGIRKEELKKAELFFKTR